MNNMLVVMVPHAVDTLMNRTKTQHLTSARLSGYELTLLASHIQIKRCNVLNPATLLPTSQESSDSEPHDCCFRTEEETKGRIDLKNTPLSDPDGTLYVDGSCFKLENGDVTAAYAVTTLSTIVETARVSQNSAQAAELIALTRACVLAKGKRANVFTDSQYAFGVAHSFGRLWKERGFITSHGTKIQHGQLVNDLLESLTLPTEVAIVKCSAHKAITDDVGRGNAFADEIAKQTARNMMSRMYVATSARWISESGMCEDTVESVKEIQKEATEEEKRAWRESTGKLDSSGCWIDLSEQQRWMLPDAYVLAVVTMAHGTAHISSKGICKMLAPVWKNDGISKCAERVVRNCMVCLMHNPGKGIPTPAGHFAPPSCPFEVIQLDFIHMDRCNNLKYVLVVVCAFSRWIEAYPLKDNTALSTAKILLKEYFPRYGMPRIVWSDNGSEFVGKVMQSVCAGLGIRQKFHSANHPQSAGLVEGYNGTLKLKLAKIQASTGLSWPDALPLALLSTRATVHSRVGLSPYEIVFGRPANVWGVPRPKEFKQLEYPMLIDYLFDLTAKLSLIHQQVFDALPKPPESPGHQLKPGDQVVIRNFARTKNLQPRFIGPFQVLLATRTAIRVVGRKHWIHTTHAKRVPLPLPYDN
ncbi:protein NYNRIN-like [Lissotriton helveticus]